MSADFGRALEPLRADLTAAVLADPAVVRRQGDHRRQRQLVAVVVATLVVLGGTAGAITYGGAPWRSAPAPGATTTPSIDPTPLPTDTPPPTDPPTETPAPDVPGLTGVPDAAMLPELRDLESYERAQSYLTFVSPPSPCADGDHRSDAERLRYRAAHNMMPGLGASPEVVIEYVAQYGSATAAGQAVAEIRADVQRCPGRIGAGVERGDQQWSVAGSGFAGDESVLFRLRAEGGGYQSTAAACCRDYYLAVVRSGDVMVALTSLGWEGSGSDPAFTRQTAVQALEAARTL
jgi:hypothetical protein